MSSPFSISSTLCPSSSAITSMPDKRICSTRASRMAVSCVRRDCLAESDSFESPCPFSSAIRWAFAIDSRIVALALSIASKSPFFLESMCRIFARAFLTLFIASWIAHRTRWFMREASSCVMSFLPPIMKPMLSAISSSSRASKSKPVYISP